MSGRKGLSLKQLAAERRKHKTYDSSCYALAETFLQDEPGLSDDVIMREAHDLAAAVQQAVEDFLCDGRERNWREE